MQKQTRGCYILCLPEIITMDSTYLHLHTYTHTLSGHCWQPGCTNQFMNNLLTYLLCSANRARCYWLSSGISLNSPENWLQHKAQDEEAKRHQNATNSWRTHKLKTKVRRVFWRLEQHSTELNTTSRVCIVPCRKERLSNKWNVEFFPILSNFLGILEFNKNCLEILGQLCIAHPLCSLQTQNNLPLKVESLPSWLSFVLKPQLDELYI